MFKHAIVRVPGSNFADGLTTVDYGVPVFEKVLEQHAAYCKALKTCGLGLTHLPADTEHPDSTFVEDTAVVTPHGAILMRPGAASRAGEVTAISLALKEFYAELPGVVGPGTVDGGDICETDDHFFIGISHRTNEEGARQLAELLKNQGYKSSTIDVREMNSILHLKSGISYIGDNTVVVMEEMAGRADFANFKRIVVSEAESYAANCIRVNEYVLVAEGFPGLTADLEAAGFKPMVLDMSEYRKMDGGLSCLSLRLP